MSIIATAQIIAAQFVSKQKNVKLGSHASQQLAECSTDTVWMDTILKIISRADCSVVT